LVKTLKTQRDFTGDSNPLMTKNNSPRASQTKQNLASDSELSTTVGGHEYKEKKSTLKLQKALYNPENVSKTAINVRK
jgi:hypothetical protein